MAFKSYSPVHVTHLHLESDHEESDCIQVANGVGNGVVKPQIANDEKASEDLQDRRKSFVISLVILLF